jgi:carbohydrate-binding DOMON domain-containing protein
MKEMSHILKIDTIQIQTHDGLDKSIRKSSIRRWNNAIIEGQRFKNGEMIVFDAVVIPVVALTMSQSLQPQHRSSCSCTYGHDETRGESRRPGK